MCGRGAREVVSAPKAIRTRAGRRRAAFDAGQTQMDADERRACVG